MSERFLAEMVVPGVECSVPLLRRFVGQVLTAAGHRSVDDAQLVAGELAGNAVVHTRSARPGGLIVVGVAAIGDALARIEVIDEGALTVPRPRKAGVGDCHGRGLWLVEQVSARWGIGQEPFGGTVVWAEVFTAEDTPDGAFAVPACEVEV
ncbi:ATP-binding protein [Nonomuraea purpurea]|uniref:ATP-binding protein n=1 Tax=Nonomuraea purpurea TaxID=1849276 RepID=A0ABV8G3Y1_9ACTN